MKFQINDVPIEMNQISAKLFNNQFLSDVTFIVEGKQIYAHSLELMKRSTVFQRQLEPTLGEKKLIPIIDYGYDTFYQFIRFIYTDEFDRANQTRELLKLANAYNVIRLVNILLADISNIKKLDFCITANHKIALHDTKLKVASELKKHLESDEFLSIHPDTVEQILNFDQITNRAKELDLLDGLVRWMNYGDHQKLEKLIRLVRFPTMTTEELRDIRIKYPDLLTNSDFMNIAGQKIFGSKAENGLWNCTPRMEFVWPYEWKVYPGVSEFKTNFIASSDLILGGFVLGSISGTIKRIAITISCMQPQLNEVAEVININTGNFFFRTSSDISLGACIRIRPNLTYVIDYKFTLDFVVNPNKENKYWSRKPETDVIINGPPNTVKILEAHETMLEIMFLQPADDEIR